ncbi:hypothetical protein QJS04_geneDACA000551 [Acorus gramineus]|uniref:Uncharacterized protein n=1 Tax=Acorus gramineus TaxID=55184 RepID=A0AAV9ATQ3_ACOGR|nr:hypothetical protein QJS04_geneDACA000551 [Acorus gramineus]
MPLWWFENINSEEINKVINVNTNTVLMVSMRRCFTAEEASGTVLTPKALKHVLVIIQCKAVQPHKTWNTRKEAMMTLSDPKDKILAGCSQ